MEENLMKRYGLEAMNSSELEIPGGAVIDTISKIIGGLAAVVKVIQDYIPSFIKGYTAGRRGESIF
ncbi:MAG: hypothetical protein HUJ90_03635 [Bacteroidales bacterium]|nr:hypothetical protein [Bacteroidales bacterium]